MTQRHLLCKRRDYNTLTCGLCECPSHPDAAEGCVTRTCHRLRNAVARAALTQNGKTFLQHWQWQGQMSGKPISITADHAVAVLKMTAVQHSRLTWAGPQLVSPLTRLPLR